MEVEVYSPTLSVTAPTKFNSLIRLSITCHYSSTEYEEEIGKGLSGLWEQTENGKSQGGMDILVASCVSLAAWGQAKLWCLCID